MSIGLPISETSEKLELATAWRIQTSNRGKLVDGIEHQLIHEWVREDIPFQAGGDVGSIERLFDEMKLNPRDTDQKIWIALNHLAFAIFRTSSGFRFRGLRPCVAGGWESCPLPLFDLDFAPTDPAAMVACTAADRILKALKFAKENRDVPEPLPKRLRRK